MRSTPFSLPNPERKPTVDVTDEYGVAHRVWQISDPAVIAAVQHRMRDKKLVIADGHHRYETALNFRNECRAAAGANPNPDAPYEFVMMTLVNMNDPGLLVLPTHRVVHSLTSFSVDEFQNASRAFFEVEECRSRALDAAQATARLLAERGGQEPRCWRSPPTVLSFCTLRSRRISIPDRPLVPPAGASTSYNCTSACSKAY